NTGGPAIALCLDGALTINGAGGAALELARGQAAFADEAALRLVGAGRAVVATGEHPRG
ncbi:MAG: hypothetical protein RL499_1321, partial [Actinomycetota bacterium]